MGGFAEVELCRVLGVALVWIKDNDFDQRTIFSFFPPEKSALDGDSVDDKVVVTA